MTDISDRTDHENDFLIELKALCEKYEVHIDDADQYGDEEEYTGTDYSFYGNNINLHMEELQRYVNG